MDTASVEPGKIFVGGLSWETSKDGLKNHFEKYGKVADCVIMIDPITKRPRGFGFVTFSDPASVTEVMKEKDHVLDNKKVDPKPATLKNETPVSVTLQAAMAPAGAQASTKKVFVGGISNQTTEEDVKQYFKNFGTVVEVDLKYDKATQRMRGFGFVGFESEEVVEQVCQTRFHQLNGKTVEVKKAEPRYATASATGFQNSMAYGGANATGSSYGGYGGRGGGGYSAYPSYGYGYGTPGTHAQQQTQQYSYGYGTSGYGGQSAYGQFGQGGAYTAGTDRGYYAGQQTGTTGQQQAMSYGQDNSAYGRSAYTGTDGYSSGAHNTAGYNAYDNQAAAATYQQYADNQAASYGRGMAQQRGVSSYQPPYGSH